MRSLIKNVPIPTAGVALGLAALGNLLAPYAEAAHLACGILSAGLVGLLLAKIVLYPAMIRDDLQNSILASVSATLFMALMQLAGYVAPVSPTVGFGLWCAAVVGHLTLMAWFSAHYLRRFKLVEVFPTYFICYVGIIVAAVTSPTFGMQAVGTALFWFGFACYLVLLAVVTLRYLRHEVPEAARPLFCIYAAPMSLSLAGYLAVTPEPNTVFVTVLAVLAQGLFAMVLTQLPKFLALKFYPSFAAMTFPFVITATALGKAVAALAAAGVAVPALPLVQVLIGAETLFATGMVLFVFGHYLRFFSRQLKRPEAPAVVREQALNARFAENFEN